MKIEDLTRDEILSHTAQILDSQINQQEHNRALALAVLIGILIGLCV